MFVSYHCYVAFCVSYAPSLRSTEEKLLSEANLLTTYEDEKVVKKPAATVVAKPSWLFLFLHGSVFHVAGAHLLHC